MEDLVDKEMLRYVIGGAGLVLILVIVIWNRQKDRSGQADKELDDAASSMTQLSLNPAAERDYDYDPLYADPDKALSEQAVDDSEGVPDAVPPLDLADEVSDVPAPVDQSEVTKRAFPELTQLSVVAKNGLRFEGAALEQTFAELGLAHGEMDIYHRYDHTTGAPLFSVTSMVEPGTFPVKKMESFSSPGISLFFQPRLADDPLLVFDLLVHTCEELAQRLDGSILTRDRQTLNDEVTATMRLELT